MVNGCGYYERELYQSELARVRYEHIPPCKSKVPKNEIRIFVGQFSEARIREIGLIFKIFEGRINNISIISSKHYGRFGCLHAYTDEKNYKELLELFHKKTFLTVNYVWYANTRKKEKYLKTFTNSLGRGRIPQGYPRGSVNIECAVEDSYFPSPESTNPQNVRLPENSRIPFGKPEGIPALSAVSDLTEVFPPRYYQRQLPEYPFGIFPIGCYPDSPEALTPGDYRDQQINDPSVIAYRPDQRMDLTEQTYRRQPFDPKLPWRYDPYNQSSSKRNC